MMITPDGIKISFGGRPGAGDRPVIARIFGFEEGKPEQTITRELVIPAGETVAEPLPFGLYNVQLTLPSGRILQRNVKVDENSDEVFHFMEDTASGSGFSLQESIGAGDQELLAESASATGNTSHEDYDWRLQHSDSIGDEPFGMRGGLAEFGQEKGLRYWVSPRPDVAPPPLAELTIGRGLPSGLLKRPPGKKGWTDQRPEEMRGNCGLWRIELESEVPPSESTRRWGRVELPDGRIELASLPLPWFCPSSGKFVRAELLVDPSRNEGAATTVAIRDKRLSGLLSYLDRGQAGAARPLLESIEQENLIEQTIGEKMSNPLAACAAAYVGLSVYPPNEREQWDSWLKTCTERFPGVPDAAIVHARRLILRPDDSAGNEEAAKALRRAHSAGPPFFSAGVSLLREMLLLLSADHGDLMPLADEAAQLAARVDPTQIFTVLRYAPATSPSE